MTADAAWRAQLLSLLAVARLGSQFPDAARWRSLLELLGREGPRGKAYLLAVSPLSGLPEPKALAKLHKLQFVAREFFQKHRHRPTSDARAFSMALAALELPPVSQTRAQLVRLGKPTRFLLTHERLAGCAVRFAFVVEQDGGRHVLLDRAQQATLSEPFQKLVQRACDGSATEAFSTLAEAKGLRVVEVLRGQLGPFVSGLWPAVEPAPVDVRALRELVAEPTHAVLSVQLERLAADVGKPALLDPWLGDEPPVPGAHLARERRLFCTPGLEAPLKALVARTEKPVLVRSR